MTEKIFKASRVTNAANYVPELPAAPTIASVTNAGTTAYITVTAPATGPTPTSYIVTSSPGSITGTSTTAGPVVVTGLTANTSYTFTAQAINQAGTGPASSASSSITTTINTFSSGSNQSAADLYTLGTTMANGTTTATPTAGGTLTINSVSLGSYDYVIKRGSQTVSSFLNSDWFTTTADTRSAWVVVDGNLTINAGQTFIPSNRKLFTVIYVTGDLTVNGVISMSSRGASHSATSAGNIRIYTGTLSGVSNPQIPATGGAGATSYSVNNSSASLYGNYFNGVNASPGTAGGTGGGGAGGMMNYNGITTGGTGSAGTSFGGGTGGGGAACYGGTYTGGNGSTTGGAGGAAYTTTYAATGGVGNPAGASSNTPDVSNDGTGGVLIIIVRGNLYGTGSVIAHGNRSISGEAPNYTGAGGGHSGGGSITILHSGDLSGITPAAYGGCTVNFYYAGGGAGGTGTARKLSLV